jgi:hypothetical protein
VLTAAGGAAYHYRAEISALVVSFNEPSPVASMADRRSLELPPFGGFRAGNAEAVDAALQDTALWKVVKREFPDWYAARIGEAVQLAQEGKEEAVIAQLIGRKLADLRRQNAGIGVGATAERLKAVAVTYLDNLKRLRGQSAETCAGFIRKGEAEPLIVAQLYQSTPLTGPLQAQLTAVFEAIAEGRQLPRSHPRASGEHHALLQAELTKRGWTPDDFRALANVGAIPAEKACQLVHDLFAAQLALSDPEAQMRLLMNAVRPVFSAG